MTPQELILIGQDRYRTYRFLSAMSRDTGIPYATLFRYSRGKTAIKPMAADKILALKPGPFQQELVRIIERQSAMLEVARAALKDAQTELFEATDKFHVIHCDLTEYAPGDYKALTGKWSERALESSRRMKSALAAISDTRVIGDGV